MKIRRKAQVQTQIFVYSLMIMIVGLILVYGYNAINGFRQRAQQIEMLQFQEEFKNIIDLQNHEYMSVIKKDMMVPSKYSKIIIAVKFHSIPEIS